SDTWLSEIPASPGSPQMSIADSRFSNLASTILLNHLFEIIRHFRQSVEAHIHPSIVATPDYRVHVRELRILPGIIFAKLCAATLLSFERGPGHCFGNGQKIFQIKRSVPAGIEFTIPGDADVIRAVP